MNTHDELLHRALKRERPSSDFAERVVARIEERHGHDERHGHASRRSARLAGPLGPAARRWFSSAPARWLTAAAAAALIIVAATEYNSRRRAVLEGEQAKAQLMLAIEITGEKLRTVQEKVWDHSAVIPN